MSEKIIKTNSEVSCRFSIEPIDEILSDDHVIAVIGYNSECRPSDNPRHFTSGLECVSNPNLKEVWWSKSHVKSGIEDGCYWAKNNDTLFAGLWIPKRNYCDTRTSYEDGYNRLLSFIVSAGYPNLVRVWNFIPDINRGEGDHERYKQFCYGRHLAFRKANYAESQYPAATVIGHKSDYSVIYLIASKRIYAHFENPQQVSAYHYPREFGAASPAFARATSQVNDDEGILFISGTSSILGHKTVFAGDPHRQVHVAMDNLNNLIRSIEVRIKLSHPIQPVLLKVYIRDLNYVAQVKEYVQTCYGSAIEIAYFLGEICRSDLAVEVEGICYL